MGFGYASIVTNVDPGGISPNPRVAYFRGDFDAPTLVGGETFTLNTVADDGVIVYVNGTEIGRSNLIAGPDSHDRFANSTFGGPATFNIPPTLITEGHNEVSASVHLNYRATKTLAFDAQVLMETPPPADPAVLETWTAPSFRDEFDGVAVDTIKWGIRDKTSVGYDQAVINASQVKVGGGELSIKTQWLPAPVQGANRLRYFNSGYIDTIGEFSQQYGRWAMRAKLPLVQDASKSMWSAFWLRDSRGLGEIDIMEALGSPHNQQRTQPQGSFSRSTHDSTNHEAGKVSISNLIKKMPSVIGGHHTWALEWTPIGMQFFYDGSLVYTATTADNPWFNTAFTDAGVNVRIDTRVGSSWMGFADPADKELTRNGSYDIDYVRAWKYTA
ncbi:glycosyl hydrolase family protein [Nakamurella antarctica]|uniref:Glycosyl hydrolase family protein n=1 Tax=Nakamurella antarctica TaxID=1902245 RepID=A0A3G8ZM97_9ACTN|nr:glycoside hydrolase family 16 protein [Nakamurella antarctica]AZI58360.1 glycosyl hydrolase family protein [Nakamurella antarctica]